VYISPAPSCYKRSFSFLSLSLLLGKVDKSIASFEAQPIWFDKRPDLDLIDAATNTLKFETSPRYKLDPPFLFYATIALTSYPNELSNNARTSGS